jgi:hypothetical protein
MTEAHNTRHLDYMGRPPEHLPAGPCMQAGRDGQEVETCPAWTPRRFFRRRSLGMTYIPVNQLTAGKN